MKNKIFEGDCFKWMNKIRNESVDMCYMDPPFYTKRNFACFSDEWRTRDQYDEFIKQRVEKIHDKLKPTGSLFVHCDHRANHRIRFLLDEIFGENNFRNEIVWHRSNGVPVRNPRRFVACCDSILFYGKTKDVFFRPLYVPLAESTLKAYRYNDNDGKGPYALISSACRSEAYIPHRSLYKYKGWHPPKRGWHFAKENFARMDREGLLVFPKSKKDEIKIKSYLKGKRGRPVCNVWMDIRNINAHLKERTGYPTQKPEALLERIIECSTNKGDRVLDCFAGSGTTAAVAKKMGRHYITGDDSPIAIKTICERLGNKRVFML